MLTPTGLNSTKKGYRNFTIWDAVQIALSGQKGWDTTIQNKRVFLRTVFWGCPLLCHFSGPVGCWLKPHLWNSPFTTITQETGSWFGPGKSQLRPEWEGQLLTTETAVRTAEKVGLTILEWRHPSTLVPGKLFLRKTCWKLKLKRKIS